jgi:hypothetical protein
MSLKKIISFALLGAFSCSSMAGLIKLPDGVSVDVSIELDEFSSFVTTSRHNSMVSLGSNSSPTSVMGSLTEPLLLSSTIGATDVDVDFDFIAYDFTVNISNMLAESADFFFSFNFDHQAQVSIGNDVNDDAGAESAFALNDIEDAEILFSNISTDFLEETDADSGLIESVYRLDAGTTASFTGSFQATVFNFGTGSFFNTASMSLALTDIRSDAIQVATPSMLIVFLTGALALIGRRVKSAQKGK